MQKIFVTLMVAVLAISLLAPISADEISDVLNSTNVTNSSANDSISGNNSSDNSSIVNNSTSNNTTSIPEQFKTLIDPQSKLIALIATIEGLKTTYANNSTVAGLLNSLSQFEKQANSLNNQITAFMQNSTVENGTIASKGRINSFIKREAALEHKVAVKQQVLIKKSTQKAAKVNKTNKSQAKSQAKQNKGNNK
ncbi:hypothetical protein [Methanobacterium sp.]|uniref:hypothetical protein n=1 Tax=Methanobacterium sp. TaxID=2164 RepID=UPI003C71E991